MNMVTIGVLGLAVLAALKNLWLDPRWLKTPPQTFPAARKRCYASLVFFLLPCTVCLTLVFNPATDALNIPGKARGVVFLVCFFVMNLIISAKDMRIAKQMLERQKQANAN